MSKRRRRIFSREFKLLAIGRMFGGESTQALSRELDTAGWSAAQAAGE
jgi:transposase-like protein